METLANFLTHPWTHTLLGSVALVVAAWGAAWVAHFLLVRLANTASRRTAWAWDDALVEHGIPAERIVLDPGLGFAKRAAHNWELLRHLDQITGLGFPVLVGASRKSFLGELLAVDGVPRPADQREAAHLALVVRLAEAGVWGVRVHDVGSTRDALAVVATWREGTDG